MPRDKENKHAKRKNAGDNLKKLAMTQNIKRVLSKTCKRYTLNKRVGKLEISVCFTRKCRILEICTEEMFYDVRCKYRHNPASTAAILRFFNECFHSQPPIFPICPEWQTTHCKLFHWMDPVTMTQIQAHTHRRIITLRECASSICLSRKSDREYLLYHTSYHRGNPTFMTAVGFMLI